jgi:hypothetical protein
MKITIVAKPGKMKFGIIRGPKHDNIHFTHRGEILFDASTVVPRLSGVKYDRSCYSSDLEINIYKFNREDNVEYLMINTGFCEFRDTLNTQTSIPISISLANQLREYIQNGEYVSAEFNDESDSDDYPGRNKMNEVSNLTGGKRRKTRGKTRRHAKN